MTTYPGPTAIRRRRVFLHDTMPPIYDLYDDTQAALDIQARIAYRLITDAADNAGPQPNWTGWNWTKPWIDILYTMRPRGHNTRAAYRQARGMHPFEAATGRVLTRLRLWMRRAIRRVRQGARIPVALSYAEAEGHGYGNENSGHKLLRYLPFV